MSRKIPAVVVAALMTAGSVTSFATADDTPKADPAVEVDTPLVDVKANKPVVNNQADRNRQPSNQISQRMDAHRASRIQGMTIENEAGKDLGNVRDIVIDTDRGRVKYVAVAYGGFLGLGTKLFAVPFEAFNYRPATDDQEATMVLNLDEEVMRKAPGFDADNWPNMASRDFAAAIDKHYADRDGGVNVRVGPIQIDVDADRNDRPVESLEKSAHVHRAADVIGMSVVNNANESVGTINDLMVDMDNGDVRYAALSVGGLAGIGDRLFAVSWNNFGWKHDAQNDKDMLVLNVNPETLKKAKGFDQDNWPQKATVLPEGNRAPQDDSRPAVEADIDAPGVDVDVN